MQHQSTHAQVLTKPQFYIDRILTILILISILVSVAMLVYVVVTPKYGEKFTEFYILGPEGTADDYPVVLGPDESATVIVGIVNHEYENVNYTVRLILDNEPLTIPDNWDSITLGHDEAFEQSLTFTPHKAGNDIELQFLLYKESILTKPYRDLLLMITVLRRNNGI